MKYLLTAFSLTVFAGCAGTPENGSLTHEYREQDRANQLSDFGRECTRRNGIVVVSGSASRLRRNGGLGRTDGYACQRRHDIGPGISF